jgi:hypothetical protein
MSKRAPRFVFPALALVWGFVLASDPPSVTAAGRRTAARGDAAAGHRSANSVRRVDALEDFGRVLYLDGQVQGHRSRTSTLVVDCGLRRVGVDAWRLHEGARGEGRVVSRWESPGPVAMLQPIPGSGQARVLERTCGVAAVATAT